MKVAVIGSRNLPPSIDVQYVINRIPRNCTELISGGAEGADALAREAAKILDLPLVEYLPDYERYGKRAPLHRNLQIIERADYVVAFWDGYSKGTSYSLVQCIYKRIPIRVYPFSPVEEDGDGENWR